MWEIRYGPYTWGTILNTISQKLLKIQGKTETADGVNAQDHAGRLRLVRAYSFLDYPTVAVSKCGENMIAAGR